MLYSNIAFALKGIYYKLHSPVHRTNFSNHDVLSERKEGTLKLPDILYLSETCVMFFFNCQSISKGSSVLII